MKNKLIYLSGILDGEGWFSIQRTRRKNGEYNASYMPVLGVANTDMRLMNWLQDNFDGKVVAVKNNPKMFGTKQRYEWRLASGGTKKLLPQVIPFLLLKKEQAKLLLEIGKLHSVSFRSVGVPKKISLKREELYLKLRKLNNTFHKITLLKETTEGNPKRFPPSKEE